MWISLIMLACTAVDDTLYEGPTGEGNDIFGSFDDAESVEMTRIAIITRQWSFESSTYRRYE